MQRGIIGVLETPVVSAVRTKGATPRRAFRTVFRRRTPMTPKREVTPLGGGKFRLVTTTVIEEVVTEEELTRQGIPVPKAEVPWLEPPHEQAPIHLRRPSAPTRSSFAQVMDLWRARVRERPDPRMATQLPRWLDEFGLDGVLRAVTAVAEQGAREPAYRVLVRTFRQMREEVSDD